MSRRYNPVLRELSENKGFKKPNSHLNICPSTLFHKYHNCRYVWVLKMENLTLVWVLKMDNSTLVWVLKMEIISITVCIFKKDFNNIIFLLAFIIC